MDRTEGLRLARLQVAEHASKRLRQMRERPFGMLPVYSAAPSNGVYFQPSYTLLPDGLHDSKEDTMATLACRVLLTTRYVLTGSDDRRLLLSSTNSYDPVPIEAAMNANITLQLATQAATSALVNMQMSKNSMLPAHPMQVQPTIPLILHQTSSSSNIQSTTSSSSSNSNAQVPTEPVISKSVAVSANETTTTSKRRAQSTKGCRVNGCGQMLASTSTSYCKDHVGAHRRCAVENCNRTTDGDEVYCRIHRQQAFAMAVGATAGNTTVITWPAVQLRANEGTTTTTTTSGARKCNFDGCTKNARGSSWFCIQHGGGKRCQFLNCDKAARGATAFCVTHGGGRRCSVELCPKSAVGKTNFCIAHGGGRRCKYPDCTHSAEGATSFCIRHGGGRRCKTPNCNKSAIAKTDYCVACGGGRRCVFPGCDNSAVGATEYCKGHGGGRRCTHPSGCTKSAQGATFLCIIHGGGKRCVASGCNRGVSGANSTHCKQHRSLAEVNRAGVSPTSSKDS